MRQLGTLPIIGYYLSILWTSSTAKKSGSLKHSLTYLAAANSRAKNQRTGKMPNTPSTEGDSYCPLLGSVSKENNAALSEKAWQVIII